MFQSKNSKKKRLTLNTNSTKSITNNFTIVIKCTEPVTRVTSSAFSLFRLTSLLGNLFCTTLALSFRLRIIGTNLCSNSARNGTRCPGTPAFPNGTVLSSAEPFFDVYFFIAGMRLWSCLTSSSAWSGTLCPFCPWTEQT